MCDTTCNKPHGITNKENRVQVAAPGSLRAPVHVPCNQSALPLLAKLRTASHIHALPVAASARQPGDELPSGALLLLSTHGSRAFPAVAPPRDGAPAAAAAATTAAELGTAAPGGCEGRGAAEGGQSSGAEAAAPSWQPFTRSLFSYLAPSSESGSTSLSDRSSSGAASAAGEADVAAGQALAAGARQACESDAGVAAATEQPPDAEQGRVFALVLPEWASSGDSASDALADDLAAVLSSAGDSLVRPASAPSVCALVCPVVLSVMFHLHVPRCPARCVSPMRLGDTQRAGQRGT